MKRTVFSWCLLFLIQCQCFPQTKLKGFVSWVYDGDTFKVNTDSLGEIKCRVAGIDAPETKQSHGDTSKLFLVNLIWKKEVSLILEEKDRYGRFITYVFLDTLFINPYLLQEGMAWHYKKYSSDPALADREKQARQKKKGLWMNSNAIPPWEFRAINKK